MSNIALANLAPAAAPAKSGNAAGTLAEKGSINSSKIPQGSVNKEDISDKVGVHAGSLPKENLTKFSFKELLQKSLGKSATNDKSDSSPKKQVIVNNEDTKEKVKTKVPRTNNDDAVNLLVPAIAVTGNPNIAVAAGKSLPGQPLKMINPVRVAVITNTKPITDKEVKIKQIDVKEGKEAPESQPKTVKDMPVTQGAASSETDEKSAKKAVLADISIQSPNQPAAAKAVSANLHEGQVVKEQVTEKVDPDVKKMLLTKSKEQVKVADKAAAGHPEAVVDIAAGRPAEIFVSAAAPKVNPQVVSSIEVTAVPADKAAMQQSAVNAPEQILSQIQNTITGSTQQIQVTLTPAELGTVRLTFRQQDGQIDGLMEIQNPEVRKEVEKALPQIAAALVQNGIQVRRMDIAPMTSQQQPNNGSFQSPEHEFSPSDQHYLSHNEHSGGSTGSGGGVSGRDAQLADGMQDVVRQNFDLSGLNMFA